MPQSEKTNLNFIIYVFPKLNFIIARNWHNHFVVILYLISRTSSKNELAIGIKAQAVDLSSVSVYGVAGFRCVVGSSVPAVDK